MDYERAFAPKRILLSTSWFSLLIAFALFGIYGGRFALSYLVGVAVMGLGFLLLWLIILGMFSRKIRSVFLVIFAVFAKILLFFGLLYYLFTSGKLDHLGLILGLSTLWVVIVLKAIAFATIVKEEARHK